MFSFIILHYKNIEETIECLTKLQNLFKDKCHIIIVDNNTLSKSEEKLIQKFTKDILKLDKNYGFAKANNKGIAYARKKYKSKYYIVMNNDVYIDDENFLNIIEQDYKKYSFDMMGPYISSPSKESVNPFPVIKDIDSLNKEISRCQKLIKIYSNPIMYFLLQVVLKIKHAIRKPNISTNGDKILLKSPLHGCCIIFSDNYLKKYKNPFYDETFLFHEEEFLYQRVINDKLISLYDPELKVFHKEGSSINKSNKKERLSKLFREKTRLKSLYLLIDVMQGRKKYE